MPHPGQMLGDRYRLDDRIAAGGMGEVWQATDTVLGRDVAVKTLHAGRAGDAGFQSRFRHEARAMAVLHHPGVADVYDYGQTGDGADAYIVMARVRGEPLNQLIADRGRLSPVETLSIVAQAARALEAAHQAGIVHRDVKPSNLIVQPDGTVVLVDFGVARTAESESAGLTGAKEVVGTALYIAPEQVSKRTTGPSADVYALGAVAYHCLTGHPPFLGPNPIAVAMQHLHDDPPALPGDIPEPVRVLVATALDKEPAQRFSSAAAMADAADAGRRMLSGPSDSATALAAAVDGTRLTTATALDIEPVRPDSSDRAFARGVSGGGDRPPGAAAGSVAAAGGIAAAGDADGRPLAAGPPGGGGGDGPAAATGSSGGRGTGGSAADGSGAFAAGSATVPIARPSTSPGSTSVLPAAVPSSSPDRPRPADRRRLLLILAGVLILRLVGLGVLALVKFGGDGKSPGPANSVQPSAAPSVASRPAAPPGTGTRSHRTSATSGAPRSAPTTGGNAGNQTPTANPKPSHTATTTAPATKTTPTGGSTSAADGGGTGTGAAAPPG